MGIEGDDCVQASVVSTVTNKKSPRHQMLQNIRRIDEQHDQEQEAIEGNEPDIIGLKSFQGNY